MTSSGSLPEVRLVLFDFGDTLGGVRPPLDRLKRIQPPMMISAGGREVAPPGPLRRALRRLVYPLVARFYRLFPETVEVLEELRRRGYEMSILSNNSSLMIDQLTHLELGRFFPVVSYSEEVGVEKPHPRIFHAVLARLGRNPAETVYVGDSYRADVVGATAAGIVPVLVDRDGRHGATDGHRISDLRGLLDLLP